ncbi:SDR family oxidoreductase [Exilibacterium tricleocarpae]|uniref:Peroxisomal trans-2-enoyl-CoA reductase n=1 Tax=Exilibacterium tricleocarpae TaxID=2591008 RepID=A0A545TYZ3_9GAMM|nr:SDR family oxidoreductase [Exilibacterium tricleocarpae]TQV82442.1 SDR family oxidoreductase [Exilibacterium tricleocarpae]
MPYQSVLRDGLFAGCNMLVTGGGSGIGRCIAHELSRLGAHVVLIGRSQDKLDRVAGEIDADGGTADTFSCDIRDEERVTAVVAALVAKLGTVHGLVNNAGGQYPAPLEQINKKGFEAVVRSNLVGGFLMARECYNQSMKRTGGSIVNITADNAGGMPLMGHSGAARAGMENFTQTAAVEWAQSGVRVNGVAPGYILSSGMDTYDADFLRDLLPAFEHAVPLYRMGEEAEVSAMVAFLLSDAARYITGQIIRIDGGSSLKTNAPTWQVPAARNNTPFNGFHRSTRPQVYRSATADRGTPADDGH